MDSLIDREDINGPFPYVPEHRGVRVYLPYQGVLNVAIGMVQFDGLEFSGAQCGPKVLWIYKDVVVDFHNKLRRQ